MDSIALSWILRIHELETILYKKQQELTAQVELQAKAEALLGQTLKNQSEVQQSALEVQLQKAQLQCTLLKLETELGNNKSADLSSGIACDQVKLDNIVTRKQRLARKMKHEQKEIQEFSKLMKHVQMDNKQCTADLHLKLSEQRSQTEDVRSKVMSLKEMVATSQQETSTLHASLADWQQKVMHKRHESNELDSCLQLLKQSQADKAVHAQAQLAAEKKLLSKIVCEKHEGERRLHQEQGISKALMKRQHHLHVQLEKVKQAILVLSE